jgi:hypothetical protein
MTLIVLSDLLKLPLLAALLPALAVMQDPTGRDIPPGKKPPAKVAKPGATPRRPSRPPANAKLSIIAPPGASIELSGRPRAVVGRDGQLLLSAIAQGDHQLRVEAEGYEPWEGTVTVTAPSTSFEAPLRRRAVATGRLSIRIDEPGTEVFIDGRTLGIKSIAGHAISHDGLRPGAHQLRAVKPGFKEWQETVHVEAGETVKIRINLRPANQK